jgi:cytochrome b pre-mRNA-processing protein 3
MLGFLFRGLTDEPKRGRALFDRVVEEARREHWYRQGGVPDTIDGRFAVLATVCALVTVRLETGGAAGEAQSAALTERFIEAMDSEHRELGLNDPGLGRRVRKLVGSLARRVELWRRTVGGEVAWRKAAQDSIYRGAEPDADSLAHSEKSLRALWDQLSAISGERLAEGEF